MSGVAHETPRRFGLMAGQGNTIESLSQLVQKRKNNNSIFSSPELDTIRFVVLLMLTVSNWCFVER